MFQSDRICENRTDQTPFNSRWRRLRWQPMQKRSRSPIDETQTLRYTTEDKKENTTPSIVKTAFQSTVLHSWASRIEMHNRWNGAPSCFAGIRAPESSHRRVIGKVKFNRDKSVWRLNESNKPISRRPIIKSSPYTTVYFQNTQSDLA